jgi:hypothetical protein
MTNTSVDPNKIAAVPPSSFSHTALSKKGIFGNRNTLANALGRLFESIPLHGSFDALKERRSLVTGNRGADGSPPDNITSKSLNKRRSEAGGRASHRPNK